MLRLILSAAVLISAVTPAPQKWPGQDGLSKTEQVLLFEPLVGLDRVWDTFKTEHGKVYAHSTEEMVRRQIFADNLKHIEMHNYLYSKGLKSYMLGVNEYSDMDHSEFIQKMTGLKVPQTPRTASTYLSPNVDFTLPTSIDWREKGYVTAVKNQGGCGSCWTFSTTGAVEGQNFRKTGKLVSLSEQNLVDCVTEKYESHGCEGGNMRGAMHFIKDNGGIDTEKSYPYEGKEGECRYNATNIGATVTGYVEVPQKESKLTEALATIGPISIGIDANHKSFMHYKSGVFNEPECTNQLNHGVLAIGYGTLNGDDYYIVKNSWGLTWGEKGYVRMSRNKKNQCGISLFASYPLV